MNPSPKYKAEIQQMMFVSGELADPLPEVTTLVEEIVRTQVIEMLTQATLLAQKRGARTISTDELIFLIRHDKAKINRLRTYLSWKDVRKNAKEQEGVDELGMEDGGTDAKVKVKRNKIKLPWEANMMFTEAIPEDDEEDEEEIEANYATLQRLKNADDRTRQMTRDEYVHWSECRQASFTFRKGKRFREWCGMANITESRPNDDIVDILGFLTFEIVATITEEGLKVQKELGEDTEVKVGEGLFVQEGEGKSPLQKKHIEEAYRRLQLPRGNQTLRNFRTGMAKCKIYLI
ncbi:SAGA complex subunit spt3 [Neolecta irregularis DAH-3]|uniref:SAGA complex subunit spt3 n=1 Tax=Neolecta irregularis (strain DAH-3) TaxID=1198029 RepID=A0A1U7LW23_NEOID|nr:SAGA complex subunit spt3 [Neolecta irregularis DAH-3]|eukprot:OLL26834.1 SAGA complex subunit spt3 [Neolecta irregularis DAH-3]